MVRITRRWRWSSCRVSDAVFANWGRVWGLDHGLRGLIRFSASIVGSGNSARYQRFMGRHLIVTFKSSPCHTIVMECDRIANKPRCKRRNDHTNDAKTVDEWSDGILGGFRVRGIRFPRARGR